MYIENCIVNTLLEHRDEADILNTPKCLIRWAVCCSLLCLISMIDNSAMADDYDLFIVTGQSNQLGAGAPLSQLPAALQGDQNDILFRYWTHQSVDLNWNPLSPQPGAFGPEITLGRALADSINPTGRKVAIVKVAFGGTAMHEFAERRPAWDVDLVGQTFDLPAGVGPDHSLGPGVTVGGIHHYERSINTIDDAIANLQADGHTVNVAGTFWMQGESDTLPNALEGYNGADIDDKPAVEYEANLNQMVGDLRTRYNTDMAFVFGRIRNRTNSNFYVTEVRQSMHDSAAADNRVALVTTDDFNVSDSVHFASHQAELGNRFFAAYQRSTGGDVKQTFIEDTTFAAGSWSASVLDVDGTPAGASASVSQNTLNDSNGPLDRRGNVLRAMQSVPGASSTRVALIKENASYNPSVDGPILDLEISANQAETPSALNNTSAFRYLLLQDGKYYAVENSIHQTLTSYGQTENTGLGVAELSATEFRLWDPVTHDFASGIGVNLRPNLFSGGEIKFGLLLDESSTSGSTFDNYFDDFSVDISHATQPILLGDLTGDGLINGADVDKFVANWRLDTSGLPALERPAAGDMDFDGLVSLADAGIMHEALLSVGSSISVYDALEGVPEPCSLLLFCLGGIGLLNRCRTSSARC